MDVERYRRFLHETRRPGDWQPLIVPLERAIADGVFSEPEMHLPGIFLSGEGYGILNAGHLFGVDCLSDADLTRAMVQGRKKAQEYMRFYRSYVEGCEHLLHVATAAVLGVRETRRIVGEYVLNVDDFVARRSFDDEIGRFNYSIDIHRSNPSLQDYEELVQEFTKGYRLGLGESYGIPYRCAGAARGGQPARLGALHLDRPHGAGLDPRHALLLDHRAGGGRGGGAVQARGRGAEGAGRGAAARGVEGAGGVPPVAAAASAFDWALTEPILLVGISNCHRWVFIIVVGQIEAIKAIEGGYSSALEGQRARSPRPPRSPRIWGPIRARWGITKTGQVFAKPARSASRVTSGPACWQRVTKTPRRAPRMGRLSPPYSERRYGPSTCRSWAAEKALAVTIDVPAVLSTATPARGRPCRASQPGQGRQDRQGRASPLA